jgi:enoyl-CoA hydratase/carnithine racemase
MTAATAAVTVTRDGDVAVVHLTRGENRFHPELLDGVEQALDEIEQTDGPLGVVITGAGKFFSNGLDLDYLGSASPDDAQAALRRAYRLLARLLGFPAYTVAAIGGHAFAAGAMLSLACDERVMRRDRGFFCLPEVDLGLPFGAGMQALITSRLTPTVAHEAMVTGRRYGGEEAAALAIVDAAVAEEEVLAESVRRAQQQAGKPRSTMGTIKRSLYGAAIGALDAQAQDGD